MDLPSEAHRLQLVAGLENYVDLKICILTDWTIEEVSDQGREALLPQVLFLG